MSIKAFFHVYSRMIDFGFDSIFRFPVAVTFNPLRAKWIFAEKQKKKFLGNFIATLVFM